QMIQIQTSKQIQDKKNMNEKQHQHRLLVGQNSFNKNAYQYEKVELKMHQSDQYNKIQTSAFNNEFQIKKTLQKEEQNNYNPINNFISQLEKYQQQNDLQRLPPLDKQQQLKQKTKRGSEILVRESQAYEKQVYKQQLNKIIQNSKLSEYKNLKQNIFNIKSINNQKNSSQSLHPKKISVETQQKSSFEELENDYENKQSLSQQINQKELVKFNQYCPTFNVVSNKQLKSTTDYNKNAKSQLLITQQKKENIEKQINSTKLQSQKNPSFDIQDLQLNDSLYLGSYKDQMGKVKQFQISTLIKTRAGQYSPHEKKINQDSSINILKKHNDQQIGFFGVLDGHEQNGGRVELQTDENGQNEGIYRVWNKNMTYPGLAMSRSLGDKAGREVGVISEPEIVKFDIGEDDKFIVIASDGVWEFLSNDEVCKIVQSYYKTNNINGAAESIIKQSVKLWQENDDTIDDITCIILFIKNNDEQKINKK
ncbi:protein phosphatase 2c, putative, partial [Ichthyophthirius multifiliis]